MCGIAGVYGEGAGAAEPAVRRMAGALAHRGPDGEGIFAAGPVVLGHRRLSIVDLSEAGRQPMANEDATVHVSYNGEIYNFPELRAELAGAGHRFASSADSEVLVHGYEEWGIRGLLERLRGMFAFAVYDAREGASGRFFLARDRFGIKPLYYAVQEGRVVFASEVRALEKSGLVPREADPRAALGFLLFGSVPGALTTLKAVRSLAPGHYLEADGRGEAREVRFYDRDRVFLARAGHGNGNGKAHGGNGNGKANGNGTHAAEGPEAFRARLRPLLEDVVRRHLISDAPLGVFLSGGIDSSALALLAALAKPDLETVSIVFEDDAEHSEEPYQRMVLERLRGRHHRIAVSGDDFRQGMEAYLAVIDQPTVDGLNTYFVAEAARRAGLKAVLSGLGGDEVFAGYPTLARAPRVGQLFGLPAPLRRAVAAAGELRPAYRKLGFLRGEGALARYLVLRGLFAPREAARLLGADEREAWALLGELAPEAHAAGHGAAAQQHLEMRHYLTDQLLRDSDVFGMAHSVEIRVPLLDHVLVEAVLATPLAWSFDPVWPKPLLSRTLADLLPEGVVFRRKQGFTFPLAAWMRAGGAEPLPAGSAVDRGAYASLWREFAAGRLHWSRVWAPLILARLTG